MLKQVQHNHRESKSSTLRNPFASCQPNRKSCSDAVFRHQMLKQVQHDIPFFRNVAGFENQKRRRHRNVRSTLKQRSENGEAIQTGAAYHSTVTLIPLLWLVYSGAYILWMVVMPFEKLPFCVAIT